MSHVAPGDDRPLLSIDLERTADAPGLARAAINGLCREADFTPAAVATLTLLVSEVVTNAVLHPDPDIRATIALLAWVTTDTVHVEVRDAGRRFTPRVRDPSRIDGGYGLYLVEQEAARWGLRPGPTTTVWFDVATHAG